MHGNNVLDYKPAPKPFIMQKIITSLAIGVSLSALFINPLMVFVDLWNLPAGTEIRPLFLVGKEFVVAGCAAAVEIGLAALLFVHLLMHGGRWRLVLLLVAAAILASGSFFVGGWTEAWITRAHHLVELP